MHIDASDLPAGSLVETDVCVVGAGPAGITVARELASAGREVLLLDSGPVAPDACGRELAAAESVGYPYFPVEDVRLRAFGGTSHGWPLVEGWRVRPLDAVDLEAGRGREVGWPFGRSELARWEPAAHERCGLLQAPYDPEHWADDPAALLPTDPDRARTSVFRYSRDDFTDPAAALGPAATRVRVLLNATAVELRRRTADPGDPVDTVVVAAPDGRRSDIRCRVAVLAAGGIENAVLLLASDRDDPGGLGNRSDLVGRHFMERLTFRCGAIVPTDPGVVDRLGFYDIHRVEDQGVQGALTLPAAVLRANDLRNVAFFVNAASRTSTAEGVRSAATLLHVRDRTPRPAGVAAHLRTIIRDAPAVARTAGQRLGRVAPGETVLVLRAQAEPTPLRRSRVTRSDRRDALGRRRARLDWQVDPADLASVHQAQELVAGALESAGVGRLLPTDAGAPTPLVEGAHHHLGTTRMHPDPSRGVVDADGRVHGVPNLYVAGSSVFPTAGYANPTLTIVALALRLGAHLARG